MDDKTQRERLEQELRFLKESFEAEVISKEEFEKGKERIERKLKEIGVEQDQKNKESKQEQVQEKKADEAIEYKDSEKIKLNVIQDEVNEQHKHIENLQAEPIKEGLKAAKSEKPENIYQNKKHSKFFKFAVMFIILILIAYFSYSVFKKSEPMPKEKIVKEYELIPVCSSDNDCRQEGKLGFCLEPETENARCEFKDIQKIKVMVLNDRNNCFNCDTQRILDILKNWLGAIDAQEIDYNSIDGKDIASKLDLRLLPAYIFEENITYSEGYKKFKESFIKKDSYYVLSEDAAASTYYYKRENVPNKLDLFVISGDKVAAKTENNLKEFLEAFKEVKFDEHFSNDELTRELSIRTFPTFLINNRIKFSGVIAAETIKNNFCKLNKLDSCANNLSKNLI